MMRLLFVFLWLSGLVSLQGKLSGKAHEDFEWFSTLGYPEISDKPWVEFTYGQPGGEDPSKAAALTGFLLAADSKRFTVLQVDLRERDFQVSATGTPDERKIGWAERSFAEAMKELPAGIRRSQSDSLRRFLSQSGHRLGLEARIFFLAYACWRKGDEAMASGLYEVAEEISSKNSEKSHDRKGETLRQTVARQLAHAETWKAVLSFGASDREESYNPKLLTRVELLEMFRVLAMRFPENPHGERVKQAVTLLEQMVAEDEKHRWISAEEIARLPLDEQVREWIFRLRDQNGQQYTQPGSCNIFGFPGMPGTTPAHQLEKIGLPAVPQLIEALSDPRFSRSVGFHRDFHFSHHVLTVGDCAQQILEKISKRIFYSPASTSSYMARDGEVGKVREEAKRWWDEIQVKGEVQSLIDRLSEGRELPLDMAARLKALKPEALEGAMLAGAKNAEKTMLEKKAALGEADGAGASDYIKNAQIEYLFLAYLGSLGAFKGEDVRQYLSGLLASNSRQMRVEAAQQLWKLGDPSAVPAMREEWKSVAADADNMDGSEKLIGLLVATAEPKSIDALSERWAERSIKQRKMILWSLAGKLDYRPENQWRISPETADAVRRLILPALEDSAVCEESGSFFSSQYGTPHISDIALCALTRIFPNEYAISPLVGRRQREAEIRVGASILRRHLGLEDHVESDPKLPKLPVAEALKIVLVRVSPNPPGEWADFLATVEKLKGSNFDESTIPGILWKFALANASGLSGLAIEASREDDLTGVTLTVHPIPGKRQESEEWTLFLYGTIANSAFTGSTGYFSSKDPSGEGLAFGRYRNEVREQLRKAPQIPFIITASLQSR